MSCHDNWVKAALGKQEINRVHVRRLIELPNHNFLYQWGAGGSKWQAHT